MMEAVRLTGFTKPFSYSNKVYVGNWFEDRCVYKKHRYPINTTYNWDFQEKPYSVNDPEVLGKLKLQSDGLGSRVLTDHGRGEYLNNMCTVYDLSFNHFPNWYGPTPIHRKYRSRMERYEPGDEFLMNYGNVTKYGIAEMKKNQWHCENPAYRRTLTTDYQDSFLPPTKDNLVLKRNAIPL